MNSRRYPEFPIPGVAGIVVGRKGILLLRRDKPPSKGLWTLPGGGVEVGETQKDALKREILEETGVESEIHAFFATFDVIMQDNKGDIEFHFLLNHYLARALTEDIRPEFPDGEVQWFELENLPHEEIPPRILGLIRNAEQNIRELQQTYW
ncbi:MAG: hypothetical protein BAJATHORv1_30239 [Candidatus Thorarchaeota archaeon]|nr:MAG: hypothetical protein BAJATHORv1_30239 [Candidatus Thorarchaeota archaeon]